MEMLQWTSRKNISDILPDGRVILLPLETVVLKLSVSVIFYSSKAWYHPIPLWVAQYHCEAIKLAEGE